MRIRLAVLVLTLAILASTLGFAAATAYYVDSAAGNDGNDGISTSTPWRTLARAKQQSYNPGDQILLKRGSTWQEPAFMPTSSGAAGAPITLADYGTGALPKIIGNADCAVILRNVSHWTLRNLDLTQAGLAPLAIDAQPGKDQDQYSDTYAKAVLEIRGLYDGTTSHVRVENCKVHDGHWNGIYIAGGYYQLDSNVKGYADDIVISGCESYNNEKSGLDATCTYTKAITYTATNIQVLDSVFHDNGADGVVFGPVGHGLIDHCEAYRCGLKRNARLGIWCWDSLDVVIQFCESHHNVAPFYTSQTRDGGGFDLDLGTEDCVIQYCYSHDNTGEGYLLMTWPIGYGFPRGVSHNQTLRYCISERDATRNGAGIEMFGGADAWIYNNIVYYIPERSAGSEMAEGEGACLSTDKWGKSGTPVVRCFNNIFICDKTRSQNQNAVSYLIRHKAGTITANNNCYYRVEGGVLFNAGSDITTWSGWQAAGYDAQGRNANPLLFALGTGPSGYMLPAGSPCINAGTLVTGSPRGMGAQDYFGNVTPAGGGYDIGIHEYQGGGGDTQAPTAPTSLTATAVSPSQINLTWTASTDNIGVTGYQIFRNSVQVGTSGTTSYPDVSLSPDTTYSYYVKAYDAAGNVSGPSDTTQATTLPGGGGTNLALNKATTISSTENLTTYGGAKAVDGNLGTWWRSMKRSTLPAEWIVVDLAAGYTVDSVTLKWNTCYATAYQIQVSQDNNIWTTVFTTTAGDGGTDEIAFSAVSARYVRMYSTAWSNGTERCYLNEFEIYQ